MMINIKFWAFALAGNLGVSWSDSKSVSSEILIEIKSIAIGIWIHVVVSNIEFWTFSLSKSRSVDDINDWFILATWVVIIKVIAI